MDGMARHGMAFHIRATCAAARTFQQSPCSAVSNRQRCQTMHARLDKSEPHAAHSEGAGTLTCIPLGLHLCTLWLFVGVVCVPQQATPSSSSSQSFCRHQTPDTQDWRAPKTV